MDCSYNAIYDSYAKFCNMVNAPVLSFEDWMRSRDAGVTHKLDQEANKLLHDQHDQSSVPAPPMAACSPCK